MDAGFATVLVLVSLLVIAAWAWLRLRSDSDSDSDRDEAERREAPPEVRERPPVAGPIAVGRVRSSGRVELGPVPRLFRPDFTIRIDEGSSAGRFTSGTPALDRFEELFRNLDALRLAEELEAVKEMVGFALDRIDPLEHDALGLGDAGLGTFPDPLAHGDDEERGGPPPTGLDTGGIASQDGGRPNPARGFGEPGHRAGQYFLGHFGSNATANRGSSTYFLGRDEDGRVIGRDEYETESQDTLVRSTFWEENHDGSSRLTVNDHQADGKVQITKDADGHVTKHVEWVDEYGARFERDSETGGDAARPSSGGSATNPGDAPTEHERQWGIWLWRQHRAGRTRGRGPVTTVYVLPPAPDEAGPAAEGPRIWDYVELDLAGNPDPNSTYGRSRIPPDYRQRMEDYLRERTGGLVNPPGPDAPDVPA